MPLYLYRNDETGKETVLMRTIAERDTVPGHTRIFEPCTPMPPPGSGPRLTEQARQVLEGYRQAEERGELRNKSRSEVSHIKDVWNSATETAIAAEEREQAEAEERRQKQPATA